MGGVVCLWWGGMSLLERVEGGMKAAGGDEAGRPCGVCVWGAAGGHECAKGVRRDGAMHGLHGAKSCRASRWGQHTAYSIQHTAYSIQHTLVRRDGAMDGAS